MIYLGLRKLCYIHRHPIEYFLKQVMTLSVTHFPSTRDFRSVVEIYLMKSWVPIFDNRTSSVNSSTFFTFRSLFLFIILGVSSSLSQFLLLKSYWCFFASLPEINFVQLLCIHLLHFVHFIETWFLLMISWHIPQKYSTFSPPSHSF